MADVNFLKKLFAKINNRAKVSASSATDRKVKWTPSYIVMTVIGVLLCVVLIPIFVINVTLTIKGAANKDEVPTVFGVAPLIVLSGSMEPEIKKGDLIFIKKTDIGDLDLNDIIAYKYTTNNGGWEVVTHRIIDVVTLNGQTVYKTKGDSNMGDDLGFVKQQDVVGIYRGSRVAKLGNFMLKMQEPIGMALFIGVPVVLFIGLDVLRRYLYTKKQASSSQGDSAAIIASKEEELEAVKAELLRLKAMQGEVLHMDKPESPAEEEKKE